MAVVAVGAALSLGASPAGAQRLETWTIASGHVDPARTTFNAPPPGVAARPPALRVNVLLPDGYDGVRRFPVLYLLHGHGDAFDYWINPQRGDLLHVAPGLGAIVVMPEAATGWYTDWWDGGARGSDGRGWESYVLDELIPLVERRLAVAPGRSQHAIAGLSMGGEGALFFASQRPEYFGAAASFSGSISLQRLEWPASFDTQGQPHQQVFGDPVGQQFYWTGHNPTALTANLQHTRLFVTVGDGVALPPFGNELTNAGGAVAELELAEHAADFVAAARAHGASVQYEPVTGVHDWPYWRLALASALRWGFFAPQEPPSSWSYATVASSGRAWDIRFRFSRPPATVENFARAGDVLSASGSGEVTISADGRPPFTATLPFRRTLPARSAAGTPAHRPAGAGRCARRGHRLTTHRRRLARCRVVHRPRGMTGGSAPLG